MSMTATTSFPAVQTRWHHPLLWLSLAMASLGPRDPGGTDRRPPAAGRGTALGQALQVLHVSILIYAVTLSWLLGQLPRWRRLAWWAGTVSAVFLAGGNGDHRGSGGGGQQEPLQRLHAPCGRPLVRMAASIVIVWLAALLAALLLFRAPLGDPARSLAIRAGLVIALIGMALAFLMTGPTADQLNNFQGIAGAHTVGLPDGGPGLPLLGWSTAAGDLRVPHFVGMHALQIIPLAALLLELGAAPDSAVASPCHASGPALDPGRVLSGRRGTCAPVAALAGQIGCAPPRTRAVTASGDDGLLRPAGLAAMVVLGGRRHALLRKPPVRVAKGA